MAGTWLQYVLEKAYASRVRGRLLVASTLYTIIAAMALDLQLKVHLHTWRWMGEPSLTFFLLNGKVSWEKSNLADTGSNWQSCKKLLQISFQSSWVSLPHLTNAAGPYCACGWFHNIYLANHDDPPTLGQGTITTPRQTDRHTDKQTEMFIMPNYKRLGKIPAIATANTPRHRWSLLLVSRHINSNCIVIWFIAHFSLNIVEHWAKFRRYSPEYSGRLVCCDLPWIDVSIYRHCFKRACFKPCYSSLE